MKQVFTLIFCCLVSISYGQSIKAKIQGRWICDKVVDSHGKEVEGKYGMSNEYLQFFFNKSSWAVLETPFNRGLFIEYSISKKDSIINLYPAAFLAMPEDQFKVVNISDKEMILLTHNYIKQPNYYFFTRQDTCLKTIRTKSTVIDFGTMIIKHTKPRKDYLGANRVAGYEILNNKQFYYPTPYYDNGYSTTFGHEFSINFIFPEDFQIGSTSSELIVEFDVGKNGAENISIVKGISEYFDQNTLYIIDKLSKHWYPVISGKKPIETRVRFHIYFFLGIDKLL